MSPSHPHQPFPRKDALSDCGVVPIEFCHVYRGERSGSEKDLFHLHGPDKGFRSLTSSTPSAAFACHYGAIAHRPQRTRKNNYEELKRPDVRPAFPASPLLASSQHLVGWHETAKLSVAGTRFFVL